jgi:[ribosomal protein S5]-alanine N-acetyltransferase
MVNQPDFFLSGETIALRPLTIEDVNGPYAAWLNDPEVTAYNAHGRFPQTQASLLAYVNQAAVSDRMLVLAVIDKETMRHIGNISLQGISWIDRQAEIAFLLGEKDFHGKGIMYEAGKILIHHAFHTLNLHRIHCGTSAENKGMQKLASKLGFLQEGVRRDAIFKDGKYIDILEYGLLKNDEIL